VRRGQGAADVGGDGGRSVEPDRFEQGPRRAARERSQLSRVVLGGLLLQLCGERGEEAGKRRLVASGGRDREGRGLAHVSRGLEARELGRLYHAANRPRDQRVVQVRDRRGIELDVEICHRVLLACRARPVSALFAPG
jgi:hypothetical protein